MEHNPNMARIPRRIRREKKTVSAMIRIYCHQKHGMSNNQLCPSCQQLRNYALLRLEKCPFGEMKSTCAKCPIHCYKNDMRQAIKEAMRYAGPKMLVRYPILTIRHLLDKYRKPPELPTRQERAP